MTVLPSPDLSPDEAPLIAGDAHSAGKGRTVVIACGALAREIVQFRELNGMDHLDIACLPAKIHNMPQRIPDLVREKIQSLRGDYDHIAIAIADCGTGGLLDKVLAEEKVDRIGGPHCYAFYAGGPAFEAMADEDPTCFYLTDYMVRQFDHLIIRGLGLDRFPHLRDDYFGNYTKCIYLAQTDDPALQEKAKAAAARLGLAYEYQHTGYGELADFIAQTAA